LRTQFELHKKKLPKIKEETDIEVLRKTALDLHNKLTEFFRTALGK
jgi:hypothetical protein